MAEGPFCRWCGRPAGNDPEGCDGSCHGDADPPRFCPTCRRRLTVYVTLGYFAARCRDHGDVADVPEV